MTDPDKRLRWLSIPVQTALIILLTIYRFTISPLLHALAPGSGCRFEPSCSQYALTAIRRHGPLKGSWMAIKRLSRCHPWGDYGYDPVPEGCSCTKRKDHQHPSTFGPSKSIKGSTHPQ